MLTDSIIDSGLMLHAIQSVNDGIVITDNRLPDNPIIYVNPAFERLSGYRSDEILNKNCRFLQGDFNEQAGLTVLREALSRGKPCRVDLLNYRKDGTSFWNELSISPVLDNQDKVTHFIGVQKDITRRKELEAQLYAETVKDGLTNLYNRRGLDNYWKKRTSGRQFGDNKLVLAMIDLNHFKQINDEHGHINGDKALVALAEILEKMHREPDMVARLGGDEFVVLVVGDPTVTLADYEARLRVDVAKALDALSLPFKLSVSIGCAVVTEVNKMSLSELIEKADKRMYQHKGQGDFN